MYLLDTNIISDTMKRVDNAGLLAFMAKTDPSLAFMSSVTLAEISFGIHLLPDGKRKIQLQEDLKQLAIDFSDRILDVDGDIAIRYGAFQAQQKKAGFTDNVFDSLIIATAQEHSLIVVTRNEKDFRDRGVKVLNPYSE